MKPSQVTKYVLCYCKWPGEKEERSLCPL